MVLFCLHISVVLLQSANHDFLLFRDYQLLKDYSFLAARLDLYLLLEWYLRKLGRFPKRKPGCPNFLSISLLLLIRPPKRHQLDFDPTDVRQVGTKVLI